MHYEGLCANSNVGKDPKSEFSRIFRNYGDEGHREVSLRLISFLWILSFL